MGTLGSPKKTSYHRRAAHYLVVYRGQFSARLAHLSSQSSAYLVNVAEEKEEGNSLCAAILSSSPPLPPLIPITIVIRHHI